MKDAVEIGSEHAAPLFLGAVDEGVPPAATNAGIGETAIDPAEPVKRGGHYGFHRGGIGDVADAGIDLAAARGHGRRRARVLVGVAAPDRDVAARGGQRLCDAEANAAIATGDNGHAAGEVENTHERFQLVWREVKPCGPMAGRFSLTTMDKPAQKIKYGLENRNVSPRDRMTPADTPKRKSMQFKHVTLDVDGPVAILRLDHQEVMNAVSMDMLGGLAEALDTIEDQKSELRCVVITGAGRAFCTGANLQGRNNQKPGKSNAGASLETAFIHSCGGCATCIARWSPPSTAQPPAPA